MNNLEPNQYSGISFQPLPPAYEKGKKEIPDVFTRIYSNFNFNYIKYPLPNNDIDEKLLESFLFKTVKDYKFIVYEISDVLLDKSTPKRTIFICVEQQCFIIESPHLNADFLKNTNALLINTKENTNAAYEANSFCENYRSSINSNKFVKITINPIIIYLIRRYFCPSEFFVNQEFFTFRKESCVFEENYKTKVNDFNVNNKEEFNESYLSFSNQIIDEMKNDNTKEKMTTYEFTENEFKNLRTIETSKFSINLVIHIETLYLFIYKQVNNPNCQELIKNIQHEIDFCSHFQHRCLTRFYGFVKKKGKILGEIYEFMSNGNLKNYTEKNKTNEIFNLITINRIFQGINYLHSNSLIHRDIRPFNILVDHNNIPHIADYDTVRYIEPDSTEEMTNNIGVNCYASPEQQMTGAEVSFPTDIYSFGQIIYFLYKKKDMYEGHDLQPILEMKKNEYLPGISDFSNEFQSFLKSCLSFDPSKRPTMNEIKLFICEQLNLFTKGKISESKTKSKEALQYLYEDIIFKSQYLNDIFEHVQGLYGKNDYVLAKRYFDLLADLKFPRAYFSLGRIYQYGQSVPIDLEKAVKYFKLGAEHDDFRSNFILGQFYYIGNHVEQSEEKAIYYFKQSAKYFPDANFILGGIYLQHEDAENSRKYLEAAAEEGHLGAIYSLGELNLLEKKYDEAKKCFEIGTSQNHTPSIFALGLLYYSGTGVQQSYSEAKKYFDRAAEENYGNSFLYLGIIYEFGLGLVKDYARARYNYEKAIEFGQLEAYNNLGSLLYKGMGNNGPNFVEAKNYFELSSQQGNSDGFLNLGLLYYAGEGVAKDYLKAKELFEKSAEQGNIYALYHLGIIFYLGKGIEPDYQKALQYFEMAAKLDNYQAFYYLGYFHENGLAVNLDVKKAINFYQQSAASNLFPTNFYISNDICLKNFDNNMLYYPSSNNLGLIHLTELSDKNQDLAKKYLSNAGLNEYSYGENNYGLLNQFFLENITKAESFYEKASSVYSFALSEYNLGYIYENVKMDIKTAIQHYQKALEYTNLPLTYHNEIIDDFRLNISKSFVACFINLKLASFSLSKDDQQSINEAKIYFIDAIFHILFTLLINNEGDSYEFTFKTSNDSNGSALNLKDFFFNFPLFKYCNQISKSSSEWKNFETNSSEKSRFRVIVIRLQSQNERPIKENTLRNLMDDKNEIIDKAAQKLNEKLKKANDSGSPPVNEPDDFSSDDDFEYDDSEQISNQFIEGIFVKMNVQKLFRLMDNAGEANYNDPRLIGNDSYVIRIKSLENKNERFLKYPKCLCQMLFRDMQNLKRGIDDIINIMKNILYTPPYNILFGRIQVRENRSIDESV